MGFPALKIASSDLSPRTAHVLELLEPVAPYLARVEELLGEQVPCFPAGVQQYVRYVLGGSGKRLRPSLAILGGGASGRIGDEQLTLGVIVELIHVATLVHDDILDEADLRHGLPTANARWSNDLSVLLGDCLFAHALELAAGYPTTEVCRRVSRATNVVCAGEILQTQRRFDLTLGLDEYLDIINMKTGALFAVSCELGAYLNGAPTSVVQALERFGGHLGIAYQIYDDCVDLFGQEHKAGKSLGTDVKKGKLTLPYLLLLEKTTDDAAREELGQMIFRDDAADRQQLRHLVSQNGLITRSLLTIETYAARAQEDLLSLPANRYSSTLAALLDFITTQSRQVLGAA